MHAGALEFRPDAAAAEIAEAAGVIRTSAAAVAQGHSNAGIAAQLHMSLATVKAHVSRLLARLGAENRSRSRCWSRTP